MEASQSNFSSDGDIREEKVAFRSSGAVGKQHDVVIPASIPSSCAALPQRHSSVVGQVPTFTETRRSSTSSLPFQASAVPYSHRMNASSVSTMATYPSFVLDNGGNVSQSFVYQNHLMNANMAPIQPAPTLVQIEHLQQLGGLGVDHLNVNQPFHGQAGVSLGSTLPLPSSGSLAGVNPIAPMMMTAHNTSSPAVGFSRASPHNERLLGSGILTGGQGAQQLAAATSLLGGYHPLTSSHPQANRMALGQFSGRGHDWTAQQTNPSTLPSSMFSVDHQAHSKTGGTESAVSAPRLEGNPQVKNPSCEEGQLQHFTVRQIVPLSTEEDENWLSDFLCFVRSDVVEVFRASREDVASRMNSKKVSHGQIGIRCRFCAHLPHRERAGRSSSFPSSINRIYQSLTMMLRDHFGSCSEMPPPIKKTFFSLKAKTSQGAADSKRHWIDSAMSLGMVDTPEGIMILDEKEKVPFEPPAHQTTAALENSAIVHPHNLRVPAPHPHSIPLVLPEDKAIVSEYLFTLMSQMQRVFLEEDERVGSRRSLEPGTPGLGCKHCSHRGGMGRLFPARRRTLPCKVKDIHAHIMRCSLCPEEIQAVLSSLQRINCRLPPDHMGEKTFFDHIWLRLHAGVGARGSSVN